MKWSSAVSGCMLDGWYLVFGSSWKMKLLPDLNVVSGLWVYRALLLLWHKKELN
jgi:hypothetical protein